MQVIPFVSVWLIRRGREDTPGRFEELKEAHTPNTIWSGLEMPSDCNLKYPEREREDGAHIEQMIPKTPNWMSFLCS